MRKNIVEAKKYYDRGYNLLKSPKTLYRGVKYLEKSYRLGSPLALYQLGLIERSESKDFRLNLAHSDKVLRQAKPLLEELAGTIGEEAQLANHFLAQYYLCGYGGVAPDSERFLHYEDQASALGSAEASSILSHYYEEEEHCNLVKSRQYQELAEAQKITPEEIIKSIAPIAQIEDTAIEEPVEEPETSLEQVAEITSSAIAVAEEEVDLRAVASCDGPIDELVSSDEVAVVEAVPAVEPEVAEDVEPQSPVTQAYLTPVQKEIPAPVEIKTYSYQSSGEGGRTTALIHYLPSVEKTYYPAELFEPRTKIVYVDAVLSPEEQSEEYIADQKILEALRGLETDPVANFNRSLTLLSEAAKVRSLTVNNILGDLYFYGDLLAKDWTLALHYYRLGDSEGSAYSAYRVGMIYMGAEDESLLDRDLGIRFIRKAAAAGYAPALARMGELYHRGEISLVSYQAAYTFYGLAVERGDRESLLQMVKIDEARGNDELARQHQEQYDQYCAR